MWDARETALVALALGPEAGDGGKRVPRASACIISAGLKERTQATLSKTHIPVWWIQPLELPAGGTWKTHPLDCGSHVWCKPEDGRVEVKAYVLSSHAVKSEGTSEEGTPASAVPKRPRRPRRAVVLTMIIADASDGWLCHANVNIVVREATCSVSSVSRGPLRHAIRYAVNAKEAGSRAESGELRSAACQGPGGRGG